MEHVYKLLLLNVGRVLFTTYASIISLIMHAMVILRIIMRALCLFLQISWPSDVIVVYITTLTHLSDFKIVYLNIP